MTSLKEHFERTFRLREVNTRGCRAYYAKISVCMELINVEHACLFVLTRPVTFDHFFDILFTPSRIGELQKLGLEINRPNSASLMTVTGSVQVRECLKIVNHKTRDFLMQQNSTILISKTESFLVININWINWILARVWPSTE